MNPETTKLENLPIEEAVTPGSPHPGLSVFQPENVLRYFNQESIVKEELLEEDKIELFLKNENICFAIDKIFNKQMSLRQKCLSTSNNTFIEDTEHHHNPRQSNLTGEAISCLRTKHAQLLERFRLELSLGESDFKSSICVSLPSVTSTASKSQNSSICESSDESIYSSMDEDCAKSADMVSLFWLMSVLPEHNSAYCRQALDRDRLAWKVSLYDIILVLLNWGASLQSVGLENNITMPSSLFSPPLLPACSEMIRKNSLPDQSTIVLVLSSISERLPPASSPRMPCTHRALLIKVLVYAALDSGHRHSLAHYCRTIRSVLDSFLPWGKEEANMIVKFLELDHLGLQNAVFVCCSIFNMTFSRLNLVGLLATHTVLHQSFGLPADTSFSEIVQHLLYPPDLLNKFKLWHVYVITSLVHSLLVRNASQIPPCTQEDITQLHQWTVDVHNALNQGHFKSSVDSIRVRERLSRLTAECASLVRTLYSASVNKSCS